MNEEENKEMTDKEREEMLAKNDKEMADKMQYKYKGRSCRNNKDGDCESCQ